MVAQPCRYLKNDTIEYRKKWNKTYGVNPQMDKETRIQQHEEWKTQAGSFVKDCFRFHYEFRHTLRSLTAYK